MAPRCVWRLVGTRVHRGSGPDGGERREEKRHGMRSERGGGVVDVYRV